MKPVKPPKGRASWLIAAGAFAILFLFLVSPLLLKSAEPRWDARDQFYPAYTYFSDSVREGRLPLWDPYSNCGYPFLADPDHVTLNPLALLLAGMTDDTWGAFIGFWSIHWLAAGLGMFLLVRHLAGTPTGAFAAAMAYAFSGFFISNAEHTPYICVAAWLPFLVLLADRAVETGRWSYAVLAGGAMGVSTLGGYPPLAMFNGYALALWLVLRHGFAPGKDGPDAESVSGLKRGVRILAVLGIVGAIGIVVWSPVLHAFFTEGANYTDRTRSLGAGIILGSPFSLPSHASLFSPYATILGREWMGIDIAMTDGYAGILAFPLAAIWLLSAKGRKRWWWIPVFFLFMYWISVGGKGGLGTILSYLFPPIKFMRFSSPFRLYWLFALALGAGMGISTLCRDSEASRSAFRLLAGWSGISLAAFVAIASFLSSHGIDVAGNAVPLFLPAAVLAAATLLAWRLRTAPSPSGTVPALLALLVAFDLGGHLRINQETVWVYRDSIAQVEQYHRRTTDVAGEPGPRHPPRQFGFFNVQQVIKEPIVLASLSLKAKAFEDNLCDSRFAEVMASPVRFWLSPGAEKAVSDNAVLAALGSVGAGAPVPVFVGDPGKLPPGGVVPGAYGTARVVAYAPECVEVIVDSPGSAPSVLASTERYAAGWHATIDGAPAAVFPVNLYFRGVVVPPGRHTVVWRYEPRLWTALCALSGVTLLAVCGGFVFLSRRERRTMVLS